MRKRALSVSRDTSSSSSSSSSRPRQRAPRFQLLHGLPAPILATVCSFLSVYQNVCILRSTCRALHDGVTADCLLHSHLNIRVGTLRSLVACSRSTRALIRRIPSLSIYFEYNAYTTVTPQLALLPLHVLRCPLDSSRFLFSSLTSLRVSIRPALTHIPSFLRQEFLLSLLLLLSENEESFSSLRRFELDDDSLQADAALVEASFMTLARLRGLTRCRLWWNSKLSSLTTRSLLSALVTMQSLTFLHVGMLVEAWPELLPLLNSEDAEPLLLRLKSLVLPNVGSGMDEAHDAFLCKLSSLSAPPALEFFIGVEAQHNAAGLLSVFSLPHLTQLNLPGSVPRRELLAVASGFTSAPAPLVSLVWPDVHSDDDDDDDEDEEAAETANEVAMRSAMQRVLSRFTGLRRLSCALTLINGVDALPDGQPGCSASLYSLTLSDYDPLSSFTTSPSFPLLTELTFHSPMMDADTELLLSGCPQLLVLSCEVWYSCDVVRIAARCCPRLLDLTVTVRDEDEEERGDDTVAAPHSDVIGSFLPELLSLTLTVNRYDFSVLRSFTASRHAQLQCVLLHGSDLTAEVVLSLASLPRLRYLTARAAQPGQVGLVITEVSQAQAQAQQRLLGSRPAADADRDDHKPLALPEDSFYWPEAGIDPTFGPHQQHELRQRVLKEIDLLGSSANLLAGAEGVRADTMREVFFAELRSLLTTTLASRVRARRRRE